MVVINYKDQLQSGTFEHAIHHLINNKIDITNFYPRYKNDDNGRPAYDPAILIKIILFAYSKGITSSREIDIILYLKLCPVTVFRTFYYYCGFYQ